MSRSLSLVLGGLLVAVGALWTLQGLDVLGGSVMSAVVDCPACQFGHHERHIGPWNVREGVLGGAVCDCRGDCAERAARTDQGVWATLEAQKALRDKGKAPRGGLG